MKKLNSPLWMNPNVINTIKVCSKTIDLKMFVNGKWYFLLWPATLCGSPKLFRFMCAICAFYLLSLCDLFSTDYIRLYKHCVSQIFTKYLPHTQENSGLEEGIEQNLYKKTFFSQLFMHTRKVFPLVRSPVKKSFQLFISFFLLLLASKTKIFKNENFSLFFQLQCAKLFTSIHLFLCFLCYC